VPRLLAAGNPSAGTRRTAPGDPHHRNRDPLRRSGEPTRDNCPALRERQATRLSGFRSVGTWLRATGRAFHRRFRPQRLSAPKEASVPAPRSLPEGDRSSPRSPDRQGPPPPSRNFPGLGKAPNAVQGRPRNLPGPPAPSAPASSSAASGGAWSPRRRLPEAPALPRDPAFRGPPSPFPEPPPKASPRVRPQSARHEPSKNARPAGAPLQGSSRRARDDSALFRPGYLRFLLL
jgi:hypothetical protein